MKKTDVIAIYLPQFHRIPENDEWWGEGFTEWTNVRKATPIFEGHVQPRIPLDRRFYDLSDPTELIRQMNIAKEYGIDGFCFYHYWFKGRKLLQAPVEELLNSEKIPLPFMLSWANEPWTRTWDGSKGAQTILMNQDYGSREDWIDHYRYLSQYFKRKEYIKVNNRPVMVIYNPSDITCRKEMFAVWNGCARRDGFEDGLFIINTHRMAIDREWPIYGDAVFDFEPMATYFDRFNHSIRMKAITKHRGNREDNKRNSYDVIDYSKFGELMVQKEVFKNVKHYLGFFTGWDNTPRRGIETRLIFDGNTPDAVRECFDLQYKRSIEACNEFLFINAWNEWGEGAILEPDEINGYGYLEAIRRVKSKYE